jgi:Protein of unknown function DUF262
MAPNAPAASARPDIISLDVLLNDVDEGRVRIPRFQRPYVWTPQMMRELFESVISGYPIGSLLLWSPREVTVETMSKFGPLPIPDADPTSPVSLLLDGHQRVATLYGVLRLPESFVLNAANMSAEQLGWCIGYDLEAEETRQMRRPHDFDSPTILPLRALLKTVDFVRFARNIDSSDLSAPEKVRYLDRADAVQRKIRDYRIPLTSMRDGNVDDAVRIFSRINRSGRRMSTDQMAVALTYHEGFNLEVSLDRILEALSPYGFGDVSRTIILQTLLQGAGQTFTKPKFDDLTKRTVQEALKLAETPVTAALISAAKFLNKEINLETGKLLPYALQLLCLAVFFKDAPGSVSDGIRRSLKKWFWATSFSGWFASANTSEMIRASEAMTEFALSSGSPQGTLDFETFFLDRPLRPFPKTFDRRSARIRAMFLVQMVSQVIIDPADGSEINGSAIFADPNRADLPYVFPPDGTAPARSPANRILLDRKRGAYARTFIEQWASNVPAWNTHAIGQEAIAAAVHKDLAKFVHQRETEIQDRESTFLKSFDLHIDERISASVEEVDTDDN